jgi:Family of unknown function (DUF6499)
MPVFDWESQEVYGRAQEEAEITGFTWECLRRNPDYRRDYGELAHSKSDPVLITEFRRR